MTEKEKKILDMQSPSTRAALLRPESEDKNWGARGFGEWKAVKNASTMEEAIGARALSFTESQIEHSIRQNRGAVLAQMRKEPDASSKTYEKRSRAIDAFMFIKVKFKDLMKAVGLASDKEMAMYERHEK